jgi:fructose-1,6-bisphosphatase
MTATLQEFVRERRRGARGPEAAIAPLLLDLAAGCASVARAVARGPLAGALGEAETSNSQGERQQRLDLVANDLLVRACARRGHVAAIASEELDAPLALASGGAGHVVLVDPLDGSSNVAVNVAVGSIFSILRRGSAAGDAAFLRPGAEQVCAGYALYGPSTMLVLTCGEGVHGFTLDPRRRAFVLTHPALRIPAAAHELAVNASNERFWEAPVRRYVAECLAGRAGPRGVDFNMRWIATFVAEVHRILVRGGVFLYPRDLKQPARAGRLRLLYEANPMALVVEQAGGAASTGRARLLDVAPAALHERVPVILGSRDEVERIARYHREHDELGGPFRDPLFNTRCLFERCGAPPRAAEEAPCP